MGMRATRRQFLKAAGLVTGSLLLPTGPSACDAVGPEVALHKEIGKAPSICPYCSVGCGLLIATNEEGHITNVEGDPENPMNRGALDPKSAALSQLSNSPLRLKKVLYRAPKGTAWEEKSWDWAIEQIARRIQKTRDSSFVKTVQVGGKDVTVNRTEGIAWLGGAANPNEEGYAASKFARSLGLVYLEHQARI